MSDERFACLVIADESEEFPDALLYAGLLCRNTGWRLVILSGSPLLSPHLPGKPAVTHRLWNGPLEVRLLRLDLA